MYSCGRGFSCRFSCLLKCTAKGILLALVSRANHEPVVLPD